MSDLEIRSATVGEFAAAVEWAAAEGWNPGRDDLASFHKTDPQGFLMGFMEDEPVSSISVVRYGSTYGFLGFYIVSPKQRGKHFGIRTWLAGLKHLESRVIGLDGVVAQQDNYRASGFSLAGRNVRFTGMPDVTGNNSHSTVRQIGEGDLNAVLNYDRQFFPADRTAFTADWALPRIGSSRLGMVSITNGAVSGYGVIRKCLSGYKIGPLFADCEAIATDLLAALTATIVAGSDVSIDVPEDNPAAIRITEHSGLKPSFETARMYKGGIPDLPLTRSFGITSFELG